MTTFTKSISILALSAAICIAAPTELPTPQNGFTLGAIAEAGPAESGPIFDDDYVRTISVDIRYTRSNINPDDDQETADAQGPDKASVLFVVESGGEGRESVASADVSVAYIGEIGNLTDVASKSPSVEWTKVSLDYSSEEWLDGDEVVLRFTNDKKTFESTLVSSSIIGETVSKVIEKSDLLASVTRQTDGNYTVSVEGKDKKNNKGAKTDKNGGGLAITSVNRIGDSPFIPMGPVNVEDVWAADLKGVKASELEGLTNFVTVSITDETGEEIHRSTSSGVLNEDETGRTTDEFGYIDLGVNEEGGLGLRVISAPNDPTANATLSVNLKAEDFGAVLITATDVAAIPYREFSTKNIEFIDSGNVVDMEYDFEASIYDASGNELASGILKGVVGSEPVEGAANNGISVQCCVFEEPFEGPAPLDIDYTAALVLNEDGETFSAYFGLEGELARRAASVNLIITPDDGGSDADPEQFDLEDDVFVNIWDIPAPTGAEALEITSGSPNVSYSFSLKSDGKTQDLLGGQMSGPDLIVNGFGSGTSKSVNKANSRAELQ